MAMTVQTPLDTERVRADFAYLEELVNGKPMAYLDSAVSTQKPRQVLDEMRHFYEHRYSNVHRSVYRLAETTSIPIFKVGVQLSARRSRLAEWLAGLESEAAGQKHEAA